MGRDTLWLVGMMGAGKSAVGAALARRLDWPFVDSDAEVEERAGERISEIFEKQGEPAFRQLERTVIEEIAGRRVVAALGGGAVAQPGVAAHLARSGRVVYLRARPATLARRVGEAAARPLLAGLDAAGREARLNAILTERAPHYETAEITVDTDDLDAEQVAGAVAERLGAQVGGEGA